MDKKNGILEHKVDSKSFFISGFIFLSLLAFRFSFNHNPNQIFVFCLYGVFFFVSLYFSYKHFLELVDSLDRQIVLTSFLKRVFFALAIAILLEALTVIGSPLGRVFSASSWSLKRVALFFLLCLVIALNLPDHLRPQLINQLRKITLSFKTLNFHFLIFAFVVSFFGAVALSFIVVFLSSNLALQIASFALLFAFFVSAFFVFKGENDIPLDVEYLVIALLFGSFLVFIPALTSGLSWDDQIHYSNAVDFSYLLTSQKTSTDESFINEAYTRAAGNKVIQLNGWTTDKIANHNQKNDDSYRNDIKTLNGFRDSSSEKLYSLNSLGYIPSSMGLWLGRLLHLPFHLIVLLGKFANLLSFVLCFFFAIRISPIKKTLFAVVGLIPTNLFLAANFSYDAWLVSMVVLALSFMLRSFYSETNTLNVRDIVLSMIFMFLGLAVKAVYFPLVGLYFLIPSCRFDNKKQRNLYYAVVVIFGIVMLSSFALPYVFTVSTDPGDTRGGLAGVNPMGQISFILSNPLKYTEILSIFFIDRFFNPMFAGAYLTNYAYLGSLRDLVQGIPFVITNLVPLAIVLVSAFISSDEEQVVCFREVSPLWTLFLFVCSFILVATALYVSFTPVAYSTVNGCQFRYILPWIAPLLVFLFEGIGFSKNSCFNFQKLILAASVIELSLCDLFIVLPCFF